MAPSPVPEPNPVWGEKVTLVRERRVQVERPTADLRVMADGERKPIPLTDEQQLEIVPALAYRASILSRLLKLRMIREPSNNQELAVWRQLEELWFPTDS